MPGVHSDQSATTRGLPRAKLAQSRKPNPECECGHTVCYDKHMRLHITLEDELVAELDRRAGARRRSAFIGQLVSRALEDERRWDDIEAALDTIADSGHEWDDDPAAWVHSQRREDVRRSG